MPIISRLHRYKVLSTVLALSLLAPSVAGAVRPVSEVVGGGTGVVTKANFLTWSLEVLSVSRERGTCELPYRRVPRGLRSSLCTAKVHGILPLFAAGLRLRIQETVMRGEALQILTALTGEHARADVAKFQDIRTDTDRQAVMNALEYKWMLPLDANTFGLQKELGRTEAISLLTAVGPEQPETITIDVHQFAGRGQLPKQELFQVIWQLIQQEYLHFDKVKADEAAYRAIEGLMTSLEDPYSAFFRPAKASSFQSQLKGEITGIGAHIEDRSGVVTIVAPLTGSPAERAGILPGDQILSADGHELTDIGLEKAVDYIRGQRGTVVELKIRRNGGEMIVRITRDTINIPEIQVAWQRDVAIVTLMQFGDTTHAKIRSILAEVNERRPLGIILDLRNNPGGLLEASIDVVGNFVPRGTVVAKVKSRSEITEEVTDAEPTVDESVRVVVLVNKGSASASEIVAGALQDLKRAVVVGEQTYGKGTVQQLLTFKSGEGLKFTIATYLTPLGHEVEGIGITPDLLVARGDTGDPQLEKAMDIVQMPRVR